jgi:hypothetical protein
VVTPLRGAFSVVAANHRPYVKPSSRERASWLRHARAPREPVGFIGPRLLVAVLCLAAFGPYLAGSIRTEQLAVYAMAPLVLSAFVNLRKWSVGLLTAWSVLVLASLIGHVFPYKGGLPWGYGSTLAGLDNLLSPLMIMLGMWSLIPPQAAQAALRTGAKVVAWASAVNATVAAWSTTTTAPTEFLRPFWGSESAVSTVGERALTMGRHTGVFSQPAEAGLMYSVAAVLAVWAFSKRPALMYLLVSVISVGGILSVSKIFLLVGLPVAVALLWVTRRGAGKAGVVVAIGAVALVLSTATFFQEWTGLDYLTRLLDIPAGQSALEFYTAGRWNEDSSMLSVISKVLAASPMVGVGVGGVSAPYDSLWTEAVVVAGLLGVAAMLTVLVLLWRAFRRIGDRDLRRAALAFWVVLVGGSFGIPALTVNRAATVVWVVAALFVAIAACKKEAANQGVYTVGVRAL